MKLTIVIETSDRNIALTHLNTVVEMLHNGTTTVSYSGSGFSVVANIDKGWGVELIDNGDRRISVIRTLRVHTGWGLKEAKEFSDRRIGDNRQYAFIPNMTENDARKFAETLRLQGADAIAKPMEDSIPF